jgi:hypothetical protein
MLLFTQIKKERKISSPLFSVLISKTNYAIEAPDAVRATTAVVPPDAASIAASASAQSLPVESCCVFSLTTITTAPDAGVPTP